MAAFLCPIQDDLWSFDDVHEDGVNIWSCCTFVLPVYPGTAAGFHRQEQHPAGALFSRRMAATGPVSVKQNSSIRDR